MLTKGDDYPVHQTAEPIAFAGTDRNFYDRYFFNGYAPDGSGFFALAFGVYPQLGVADAHFCTIRDGVQHCLHASRELGFERMDLTVGPIRIEVLEPLHQLRLIVTEQEGIAADITFTARAFPIEEPRFTRRNGSRLFMDYTRMTQNGHYRGWIAADGARRDLAEGTAGTRDRSWGIRPVGAADAQPVPGAPLPQFFWQWTPINLPGGSLFFHLNADAAGKAWNSRAAWVPDGAGADGIVAGAGQMRARLAPGTRWPAGGELALDLPGAPSRVTLEPLVRFQMRGLGYTSPQWGHGLHHGALAVAREDIAVDDCEALSPANLHVQIVCRAVTDAGESGVGVFEQLAIGPYAPLGLKEMLDGG